MQAINTKLLFARLSQHQPQLLPDTLISASVMIILLITEKNQIEIPLTKRADTLPDYAGHFSLPGGIHDNIDIDLYQTAERELYEELNIAVDAYEYVGQLDDILTRDEALVRPFVVTMKKIDFERYYKISADEITSVHFLPIEKLQEFKDDPKMHIITKRRPSFVFSENEIFVWGLTAGILMNLYTIINPIS